MPSIRLLHCRFESCIRKQNLTIVMIGVIFMFQTPTFADSVYELNNYPSQQGDGTLTGSITAARPHGFSRKLRIPWVKPACAAYSSSRTQG